MFGGDGDNETEIVIMVKVWVTEWNAQPVRIESNRMRGWLGRHKRLQINTHAWKRTTHDSFWFGFWARQHYLKYYDNKNNNDNNNNECDCYANIKSNNHTLIIVIRSYMRGGECESKRKSGKGADGIRYKPSMCAYTILEFMNDGCWLNGWLAHWLVSECVLFIENG